MDISTILHLIMSRRSSRRIRPSHCPPNIFSVASRRLGHIPALPPSHVSLFFRSPSPSGLWSPSRPSTFWCPPQCRKTVVHILSLSTCPSQFHLLLRTSQLMSLISAISTTLLFVILCCHLILSIRLRHWH